MQVDGTAAGGSGGVEGDGVEDTGGDGTDVGLGSAEGNMKKKGKTQRQQAFDFALAAAFDSMTKSLPKIENPSIAAPDPNPSDNLPPPAISASQSKAQSATNRPKTREEEELDRLMKMVNVDPSGRSAGLGSVGISAVGIGASGARGEKRSREEAAAGAKQARFASTLR